jgi:hypothetical protein
MPDVLVSAAVQTVVHGAGEVANGTIHKRYVWKGYGATGLGLAGLIWGVAIC